MTNDPIWLDRNRSVVGGAWVATIVMLKTRAATSGKARIRKTEVSRSLASIAANIGSGRPSMISGVATTL